MDVLVGVDCGATNLRVGVVEENGQLLIFSKTSSPLKTNPAQFASKVKEEVDRLLSRGWEVKGMGVGTPGPLDLKKGLILPSANLGNQEPIDLTSQFDRDFDTKVVFDRDTNLALLGEAWRGAAVGLKEVVMLTLGSGVGGAIMVKGQIDRGAFGKAGEIGHMILEIRNWKLEIGKCGLGHEGCFEALINSAKNMDELAGYLGLGLANIVDIFNPEMIILGGGKVEYLPSDSQEVLLKKALDSMRRVGIREIVDEVQVVYAKLKDKSGVYGGARFAMESKL